MNNDLDESILLLIDECIQNHPEQYSKYDFIEQIGNYVFDNIIILVYLDNLWIRILENIDYYFKTIRIPRSYQDSRIICIYNKKIMKEKLKKLKTIEQPEQKTEAWYQYRHNMLTASSIWKALSTNASRNQLIYQKCSPLDLSKYKYTNIKSTLHHGNKYEPLSAMLYEQIYNTKIAEWGCKKHDTYDFIGASPDAINIKIENDRYGRMVEIKNIVNREITGNPKMEYWIQMQIQMEVWDLEECDFLETRFKEYESEEEFNNDGETFTKTSNGQRKGIIVCFYENKNPVYKYAPLNLEKQDFDKWYDKCIDENANKTWIQNIYWRLDQYSCVLVPRNKLWFKSVIDKLSDFWKIILHERIHGYDHRKPKKRNKSKEVIVIKTEPFIDN